MNLPIRKLMFYWDDTVRAQGWVVHVHCFLMAPSVLSLFLVFKGGGGRIKNEFYGFTYI